MPRGSFILNLEGIRDAHYMLLLGRILVRSLSHGVDATLRIVKQDWAVLEPRGLSVAGSMHRARDKKVGSQGWQL